MLNIQRISSVTMSAIGLAVLLLCISAVPASAQKPVNDRMIFEETFTMLNPCNGEELTVNLKEQMTMFISEDKNGCDRFRMHVNQMGTSAVSASGKYQIQLTLNESEQTCDGCIYTITEVLSEQFIGQGKAPNFKMKMKMTYTYNYCTNELLSVKRMMMSATCDGV
jgi:hypothetical protein